MSIQEKAKKHKFGIDNRDIIPVKWAFKRTQSKEIISSKLYLNLQRSLSPKEYFFHWNKALFKKNDPQYNRKIFELFQSYIVFDPDKLPENFIKLFELDIRSENIQEKVEDIFRKARLLEKDSARIVFVDDKIVIFRNEEKLVHKSWKLTKWEKRRSEIVTTFNTFSNIYDAVRSQYHTLESSQNKQDDCKILQQDILQLAQEIKFLWHWVKDLEFKKRLDWIISDTQNARNFKVLAANLQNLQNLTFTNRSIDANLLEWAKNKLYNRFKDLQKIIWIVNTQLNSLENILTQHETTLDMFLSQITFTDKQLSIDNYNRVYLDLQKKYWPISPFNIFHNRINKYKDDKTLFDDFLKNIREFFNIYKEEHKKKLSWKNLNNKDSEKFGNFKLIKDRLPNVEDILKTKS